MSTPITEAHYDLRRQVIFSDPDEGAQLIADSEARAVEAADFALQQERNIHMTTIAERDQLRAEMEALKQSVESGQRVPREDAERNAARAERAEASLHALRLVCGTTDAEKFSTWVDRANARAERAEAELAAANLHLNEVTDCAEAVEAAIVRQYARAATAAAPPPTAPSPTETRPN
jgi:hypothetical protein